MVLPPFNCALTSVQIPTPGIANSKYPGENESVLTPTVPTVPPFTVLRIGSAPFALSIVAAGQNFIGTKSSLFPD